MKKLIAVLAPLTLALTACVTDTTGTSSTTGTTASSLGGGLAMMAIKVGVQAKCVTEIEKNTYWKTGSKLLTDAKKTEIQTEVCSCVGEKATTSLTTADLVTAALDKSTQATLITKVVANSLNTCVVETLKN